MDRNHVALATPPCRPAPQPGSLCSEQSSLVPFLCSPKDYLSQVLTSFKSIVRTNFLLLFHSRLYSLFVAMSKPVETVMYSVIALLVDLTKMWCMPVKGCVGHRY